MSNSTTNIDALSTQMVGKEAFINELMDAMSQAALFGRRAYSCEGLTWGYYGGAFRSATATVVQIANGTLTLTDAATNYIEVDGAGSITSNTSGFTDGRLPLYTVVTASSAVQSYTDHRTGAHGEFRYGRHVVTIAYAASVTIDWSLGYDVVRMTLTGDLALTFANGGDGQAMMLELRQDGTGGHSITLPADVRYSDDLPSFSATATAGKMDRLGFIRDAEGSPQRYDLIAVVKGY